MPNARLTGFAAVAALALATAAGTASAAVRERRAANPAVRGVGIGDLAGLGAAR
jgi:hypothetical protein